MILMYSLLHLAVKMFNSFILNTDLGSTYSQPGFNRTAPHPFKTPSPGSDLAGTVGDLAEETEFGFKVHTPAVWQVHDENRNTSGVMLPKN